MAVVVVMVVVAVTVTVIPEGDALLVLMGLRELQEVMVEQGVLRGEQLAQAAAVVVADLSLVVALAAIALLTQQGEGAVRGHHLLLAPTVLRLLRRSLTLDTICPTGGVAVAAVVAVVVGVAVVEALLRVKISGVAWAVHVVGAQVVVAAVVAVVVVVVVQGAEGDMVGVDHLVYLSSTMAQEVLSWTQDLPVVEGG